MLLISKALRYGPCATRDHTVLPATNTRTIPAFTPQPQGITAHENVIHRYVLMIIFYLSHAIVYVFCTYYVFSSFLLCCNASAFVICAIKNYLLTYLLYLVAYSLRLPTKGWPV